MGGNAVFLHDFEKVLGDFQADLSFAFHTAAHGVGAGVKDTVFSRGGILEEEIHHTSGFVQHDRLRLSVVQGFHISLSSLLKVSRCYTTISPLL